MPPEVTGVLNETDEEISGETVKRIQKGIKYEHLPIVWNVLFLHIVSHLVSLYGFYLIFASARWQTTLLLLINYAVGVLGNTAGVHRLWSHHSYKARWPLRLFLAYGQTQDFHRGIAYWAKYHRIHHRYTETNSDPTNAKRGFLYAHIGWTYRQPTAEFSEKLKTVDVSDVYSDPIVRYQEKYYFPLVLLICYIIPTCIPIYFWNESFINAFCLNNLRYTMNLHAFFISNSFTHTVGYRPYERYSGATENFFVSTFLFGEGWHNFHHTFPWDYRTGELGRFNITTYFLDFMAKIGMAYDLKTVSPEMIKRRVLKSGDGTHWTWGWAKDRL